MRKCMKRIVAVLLLAISLSAYAQEQINLGLIPTPQRVKVGHPYKRLFKVNSVRVKEYRVDTLPVERNLQQAYQLSMGAGEITIRYVGEEGLQNARLTLEQLREVYPTYSQGITIIDWPAYRWRGWMDDISRGPVPHQAFREKQWNRLHALKYNYCNYYTEHTLYQSEFPDLAPAYAAECKPHPDEVINLQLFAHAEKTLRVPFYQHLMDSRTNFDPSVEATYDFLRQRIEAAYERIPNSPFFIINCDETEQLGTGRAKKLVDSLGADQVYVDFINRCYNIVKELSPLTSHLSPRIAMWGDIVAKNPAMMRQLPKDMTYIMWAYEPIDSFKHLIKPFKDQGNPFWVAASTGHSATMTSTPQRYIKNIANLFRDGYRDGAEGAMLTCWDDNGEALFDNSWHAQYWAAEMAWNPLKTDDPEELRQREAQFNENFERLFYGHSVAGDSVASKTSDLYAVGALMYEPAIGDWYTSAALMEPLYNFNPDNTGDVMNERLKQGEDLTWNITIDSAANPHAQYALHRILLAMQKAYLRSAIYLSLNMKTPMSERAFQKITDQYYVCLRNLKREYLRLWDQENGDYERYIVMNRYDALAREVLELDRHVFMEVRSSSQISNTSSTSLPMVQLRTLYNDRPIYYTLDGSEPTASSTKYEGPFPLERSATIRAISYNEYGEGVISEQYLLSHLGMGAKITLNTKYSDYKAIYSGGGESALIDGQLGSNTTYADGHWQGYWGDSIDATIDFGKPTEIHEVSMRFMQNTFDWILAPTQVKVYVSENGKKWTLVSGKHFDMDPRETGMRLRSYTVDLMQTSKGEAKIIGYPVTRYLRVVVPNPGPLPSWHPAPGQPSYLFTDEIIVK